MDICWVKGSENDADVFTVYGPAFKKCIKALVGHDVYVKKLPTSEHGGCWEVSQDTQKSIQNSN